MLNLNDMECGGLQARYTYDSWGKVISITDANGTAITDANHIGNLNPIRYRGYYYDAETGFYYLGSRYFDPEVGRFVNADATVNLGVNGKLTSYNLFVYCLNNPVNGVDENGEIAWAAIISSAIGGGVAGAMISTVSYLVDNGFQKEKMRELASTAFVGFVTGAIGGVTGMLSNPFAKMWVSLCVGTVASLYSAYTMEGNKGQKDFASASSFWTVSSATFASTFFNTSNLTGIATAFANYTTTMVTSIPAEIVNKTAQSFNKTTIKSKTGIGKGKGILNGGKNMTKEYQIRRTYGGMYMLE